MAAISRVLSGAPAARSIPKATQARILAAAEELAPRFEWDYAFAVDSGKIPLSEDLVLVIEDPEHKICARVAARL